MPMHPLPRVRPNCHNSKTGAWRFSLDIAICSFLSSRFFSCAYFLRQVQRNFSASVQLWELGRTVGDGVGEEGVVQSREKKGRIRLNHGAERNEESRHQTTRDRFIRLGIFGSAGVVFGRIRPSDNSGVRIRPTAVPAHELAARFCWSLCSFCSSFWDSVRWAGK